jgi:hypothetical protein
MGWVGHVAFTGTREMHAKYWKENVRERGQGMY